MSSMRLQMCVAYTHCAITIVTIALYMLLDADTLAARAFLCVIDYSIGAGALSPLLVPFLQVSLRRLQADDQLYLSRAISGLGMSCCLVVLFCSCVGRTGLAALAVLGAWCAASPAAPPS